MSLRQVFTDPGSFVLVAQKNHLIETVLLSTHNICFGCEIRKVVFNHMLLFLFLGQKEEKSGEIWISII